MKRFIESPYASGKAELKFDIKEEIFKKEKFTIHLFYYKCLKTKKEFTTTEIGDLNILQLFNQYRVRKKILFPEQIKNLRLQYNLSAAKMSELLGFGANTYSNYEKGEIPNDSNSTLLNLAYDPVSFKKIVEEKKDLLSDKSYKEIMETINLQNKGVCYVCLKDFLFSDTDRPNEFTGYKMPNYDKIANLVLFFLKDKYTHITRLNKYLFYSDFLNFKNNGFSITGMNYAAIPNGPVPESYKFLYTVLDDENVINSQTKLINDNETAVYVPIHKFNKELFTPNELESMKIVHNTFRYMKTKDIINISHNEEGWKKNQKDKKMINYQEYGFNLKGV